MQRLLLLFFAIFCFGIGNAQDPNPDDLLFEVDWYTWWVFYEGTFYERPSPNSEWEFITMDVAFDNPAPLAGEACGTVSLNIDVTDYSNDLFDALITDVVVTPTPCDLGVNQEFSDAYFDFLLSLEGQVAEIQFAISAPSGPELGPLVVQMTHPNGDFALWADVPLNVSEFLQNNFEVFPNPTTEVVQWNLENANIELARVYSVDGRLLITATVTQNQLQVSQLPAGIYFLELSGVDGKVVKRFVKN